MQKYLRGVPDVSAEHRLRALRFTEMLGGGPPLHGLICGSGTTETQKLVIRKRLNLRKEVKKLAGIAMKGILDGDESKGELTTRKRLA